MTTPSVALLEKYLTVWRDGANNCLIDSLTCKHEINRAFVFLSLVVCLKLPVRRDNCASLFNYIFFLLK